MTILIVDNSTERLESLEDCLREVLPAAKIRKEQDPFAAGKYGLFHPVDMVFTELECGKMDAFQLGGLIKHVNTRSQIYVTGKMQALQDWEIIDEDGTLLEDSFSGALPYPVTPEKIKAVLNVSENAGGSSK